MCEGLPDHARASALDGMRFDGAMTVDQPSPGAGELLVRTVPFTDPEVQRLVEDVQAHYVVIYGSQDDSPVDPTEFAAPQGLFAVGSVGGRAVAMGGWRRRSDLVDRFDGEEVAEVKRMYVAPPGRRRGYARQLLELLEDTARRDGVARLVLETGTMQPDAIALYQSAGYLPTIRFGHYADSELSRYFAKPLSAP
jgi:GNAT superfamily N-acetyltransferase